MEEAKRDKWLERMVTSLGEAEEGKSDVTLYLKSGERFSGPLWQAPEGVEDEYLIIVLHAEDEKLTRHAAVKLDEIAAWDY